VSKDAMRQAMPTVAAIVDEFRDLMKDGGKVIYASENGHVIDRREPVDPGQVFTIPANYFPMREVADAPRRKGLTPTRTRSWKPYVQQEPACKASRRSAKAAPTFCAPSVG
jgi:hypothetical protein